MHTSDDLNETIERTKSAFNHLLSGDPEPYVTLLSHAEAAAVLQR